MIYLISAFLGLLLAQIIKNVLNLAKNYRMKLCDQDATSKLIMSGGMPSAHSAAIVALSSSIGYGEGFGSAIFALSAGVAVVIMYDSMMIRYSSGRQGDLLNRLLTEQNSKLTPVKVAHGHTLIEVAAGAVLGLVIGSVVFFTTK